ncbi:MAG: MBL fold metallo-hydrolase [Myxococcota bacterium]|jgi:glyoxylase-like metal-dependent hydrolase (beta-lactamase superfamily II)|nr:MBL fold metallo-hydrolase [Deltaproteobacteria bacterium]MDP6074131.1 MBL fold metallo-hydrolase [Myxococcota bacterium]MDP6241798.1 MBL fold metallo-hydrolase [Myxococcota bacterium]MDP7074566.1 MBL fold metallo-hydrolase [Myxococcota bacterium]MDP7299462.1 MBL fold metallo-hydrolase [Myxococcota bacterium]
MTDPGDVYFQQVPVGEMANLAYLVGSRSARQCLIVDPAWAVDPLLDRAEADDMEVVGALVTHYHQDHIGGSLFGLDIEGVSRLLERKPVPIHVNNTEADGTRKVTGASESDLVRHDAGDELVIGEVKVRMIHTPGHTPGSQCFLVEEAGAPARLVAGDTLFLNACGRVDLPGSNPEDMYHSLNHTLKSLPDETLVYPGHMYGDPSDTLGAQKRTNPFLRVTSLEQFLQFMGV